jgi:hypothetical protein
MDRRKGELTATGIECGWPHQVAVLATEGAGSYGRFMEAFCLGLSVTASAAVENCSAYARIRGGRLARRGQPCRLEFPVGCRYIFLSIWRCAVHGPGHSASSTRRLRARPATVALDATG